MSHRTGPIHVCPGALVPWNPDHFQITSRAPQSVTGKESCSGPLKAVLRRYGDDRPW